jgi:hypothetical protein
MMGVPTHSGLMKKVLAFGRFEAVQSFPQVVAAGKTAIVGGLHRSR